MELRPAVPDDALAVARIHVRAWQTGYRGLLPEPYLAGLRAEDRAARYTFGAPGAPVTTVAVDGSALLGFVTTMGDELAALHVDPDHWSRGIGRALIAHARAQLATAGATRAMLWLLVGNTRAARFYERDGWRESGVTRSDVVWGAAVDELQLIREL